MSVGFATAGLLSGLLVGKGVPYYVCYVIALVVSTTGKISVRTASKKFAFIARNFSTAGFFYTLFFVKETRRPDRYYTSWESFVALLKINHLVDSCRAMVKKRPGWGRVNIWLVFIAFLTDSILFMGEMKTGQKFYTAAPLSWPLGYYMLFDGLWGLIGMIVGGLFTGVAKRKLQWNDVTLGGLGAMSHISYSLIISFAHATWMAYVAYALGVPKFLVAATCRALMSKLILKNEQGKLFSLLAAFEGVMPLLASVIFTAIFTATVDYWPGLYSLAAACMAVVPLLVFVVVSQLMRRDAKHFTNEVAPDVDSTTEMVEKN